MDYAKEVKKHGSARAAARANNMARTTFLEKYKGRRRSAKPIDSMSKTTEPTKDIGGIRLNDSVRMRTTKPSEGIKKKLFALKRGVGYPVNDLSESWGCSPETLRAHGRRHDALRYVEIGPGDWVHCVMHPETAAQNGGE